MFKCYTLLLLSILLNIYDISIFYILTYNVPFLSQRLALPLQVHTHIHWLVVNTPYTGLYFLSYTFPYVTSLFHFEFEYSPHTTWIHSFQLRVWILVISYMNSLFDSKYRQPSHSFEAFILPLYRDPSTCVSTTLTYRPLTYLLEPYY